MKLDVKHAGITESVLRLAEKSVEHYRKELTLFAEHGGYEHEEASLNLLSDHTIHEAMETIFRHTCSNDLRYIIVNGIGGSNLGAKAVSDALHGIFGAYTKRFPKLIYLDTHDGHMLLSIENLLSEVTNVCQILLITISKSGTTTETIANMEVVTALLHKKFGDRLFEQCIVISGERSPLADAARLKKMHILPIPKHLGGRFSVFSAVGLMPLLAAGIDIDALIFGATHMRALCLMSDIDKNPAMMSGAVLAHALRLGKGTHTLFVFHPELESLGKWYRQLIGESVGKEKDVKGNTVHVGLLPDIAVGSTDLHSVLQLYLAGPRDKITTFVYTEKTHEGAYIPKEMVCEACVPHIAGRTSRTITDAIYQSVTRAYDKEHLPYMEVTLADISPFELGQFLEFKMMEIMYLGKLLNINVFDQPNVEYYKEETRKILKEKN